MTLKELWRKIQLLLIIACGTYPAVMVLLNNLAPGLLGWGWAFSLTYVLLAAAGICVKGKLRMSVGLGLAAVFVIASGILAGPDFRLGAIAAAALCSALLIWSLRMGSWSHKEEIPVFWVAIGIICHLMGQLLLRADRVAGVQGVALHSGMFLTGLYVFSLLTMLSMNRKSLMAASGKRQSVPDSMRRRNGLLTAALFVLAVLASLLPSAFSGLSQVMGNAISWLVRMIAALIPDASNESEFEQEVSSAAAALEGGEQGGGGNMLDPMVEKFAAFVGALLSIALVLFLLWRIFRILREKFREAAVSLSKFASSVSEDYVDEVTDTREDGTAEKLHRRRAPKLSAREERSLPPGERIRYRYRRILGKHPEWEPGSTAREKLPEELARVYERARYSGEPMTEEEAAAFTGGTERI